MTGAVAETQSIVGPITLADNINGVAITINLLDHFIAEAGIIIIARAGLIAVAISCDTRHDVVTEALILVLAQATSVIL